ncbi:MAG: hypothetical protein ACI3YT_08510 [Prevotella sp.]
MENIKEHNINELDAMREQMQLLKQKLDNQEIVNDRILRNAMSGKMSWIKKYIWFELIVLLPVCALNFVGLKMMNPTLSWWPILSILLLVLIEILLDFYINHLSSSDWQSENLLQTADKLLKMKKLRWCQLCFSIPVAIVLFWWFFAGFTDGIRMAVTIGGIVGGVIGLSVGVAILLKMQRTNDELIRQIREIKNISE